MIPGGGPDFCAARTPTSPDAGPAKQDSGHLGHLPSLQDRGKSFAATLCSRSYGSPNGRRIWHLGLAIVAIV